MCEVVVFSPEGHQCRINSFTEWELLKITVGCFIEELVKVISTLYAVSEYTKENVGLSIGGKLLDDHSAPLSDYKITPGTAVQMMRKVNGG